MEKIIKLATDFRCALESIPKKFFRTSLGFSDFPFACCDDASLLLAAYLSDNGLAGSVRVGGINGGEFGELESHVWILCRGLIVDITADQFSDYEMPPVFVSESSGFHDRFQVESECVADFRVRFCENSYIHCFANDYEIVQARIASLALSGD